MDNSSVIANSWLPPSYPPSPLSLGLCINALTIIWMEFQGQDEWTMTESDVQLPCLTSNAYYLQSSDRKKLCLDSRYDTTLCFPQNTGEHSTQLTCLHHHLYFHTIWSSLLLFALASSGYYSFMWLHSFIAQTFVPRMQQRGHYPPCTPSTYTALSA